MVRPAVDVVVPFAGSDDELHRLQERMRRLQLSSEDTLTIVDNRPTARAADGIVAAPERQSSYYARNRGVVRGDAPWIVFIDADLDIAPDLVDRYFDKAPDPETALLIGEIETVLEVDTPVARYGFVRRHLNTASASKPGWEYAQTANAAVRRDAFGAVGGFTDAIRSGGDADLAFRIRAQGYAAERRPAAVVRHPPRSTLRAMMRQFARYGSGSQWLDERYPGFSPGRRYAGLLWWLARAVPQAGVTAVRDDRDGALAVMLDPMVALATELGRLLPNERGAGRARTARHLMQVLRRRRALGPGRR
jgi:glycosyltransferase involved in cell wall biosynthesis